jgi:hypothetical protein
MLEEKEKAGNAKVCESDIYFRNVSWLSTQHTALQARK